MGNNITGKISSIQTMGTLDGPGVRFVIFMQGCPLRCVCCHNPETWSFDGGDSFTPNSLFERVLRYREYFGDSGGITVSGGEPLMQAEFVAELFSLCRKSHISTCLDTSGCVIDKNILSLLDKTDHCLLDIKYSSDEKYLNYVGCSIKKPLEFLSELNSRKIDTRIRQVIIEGLNDKKEDIIKLKKLLSPYSCISEIELLPFRKLCEDKYKALGVDFKLSAYSETDPQKIKYLNSLLGAASNR